MNTPSARSEIVPPTRTRSRVAAALTIVVALAICALALTSALGRHALRPGDAMPAVAIRSATGEAVPLAPGRKGLSFVMLSSDTCDHCHYQLDVLENLLPHLRDARLYVVALDRGAASQGAAPNRRTRWPGLTSHANVSWGVVDRAAWKATFGVLVTPSLFVFRDDVLVASFQGETSAPALLRATGMGPAAQTRR